MIDVFIDTASGQVLEAPDATEGRLTGMFNPDGDLVVTYSRDGAVNVWDPESGALLQTIDRPGKPQAAFLDGGSRIAVWSGAEVRAFATNLETRSPDAIAELLCRESGWRLVDSRLTSADQDPTGQYFPCGQ